ncbi:unnamed protein product [Alternaria alternata]
MPADRSIAILGLQKRLSRAFNTRAAHGLFDAYFARGLLWKRRYWQRMEHIAQPPGRQVPSWSSLSKHGSIQYMDATNELRFEKVSWATDDFQNPFATRKEVVDDNEIVAFRGWARKMLVSKLDMLTYVTFDGDEDFEVEDVRCVVIGRDKDDVASELYFQTCVGWHNPFQGVGISHDTLVTSKSPPLNMPRQSSRDPLFVRPAFFQPCAQQNAASYEV